MSKLDNQWIDLFRAGDYSSADKGVFTEQDLQQIVDNYDPAHHEAPVTVGHPKGKSPAFAWIDKVRRVGNLLQGKLKDVYPAFEDAVNQKLYKKRSVGLMKNDKGWTLHHLAFLGGKAPEVKGLADLQYTEPDDKVLEIEFSEETEMAELKPEDKKSIVDSVVDSITELFSGRGAKTPAKTFSEDEVKRIAAEAATAAIKPIQEKLDAQEVTFAEQQKVAANAGSKARAEAAVAKLKTGGRWIPAFEKMGLPQIFEELARTTDTVEFGDDKKKVTPLDLTVSFFEGLGAIVPAGATYQGQQSGAVAGAAANFNETATVKADSNSVKLDAEVKKYKREHKVTYAEALTEVTRLHPELAKPGGASAGAA